MKDSRDIKDEKKDVETGSFLSLASLLSLLSLFGFLPQRHRKGRERIPPIYRFSPLIFPPFRDFLSNFHGHRLWSKEPQDCGFQDSRTWRELSPLSSVVYRES